MGTGFVDSVGAGDAGAEISLFTLGTIVLRRRWRIARWMAVGGLLATLTVITKPAVYMASASFVPQGSDATRSSLAGLAGQFGLALPQANQSLSPDFYARLLKSRELLKQVARDSFPAKDQGQKRVPFVELFNVPGDSPKAREENAVKLLSTIVGTSVSKMTGIVELTAATRWPAVSLGIVSGLVDRVNQFNQRTRQEQAAAERRFVEGRLTIASAELRAAEDRLQRFLQSNRQFANSPELTFDRERLQRDLSLQQQVFSSLTQSYEEVRIREVRDTPVITLIESPAVPSTPEPRGRLLRALLGLLLGGVVGTVWTIVADLMRDRSRQGHREAAEFMGTLGQVKGEVLGPVRWLKREPR